MYIKIKVDPSSQIKVGQKRNILNDNEFRPMKVQKLEIKNENICDKNVFKCEVCADAFYCKVGLSLHKLSHLTEEEKKNPECKYCNMKFNSRK